MEKIYIVLTIRPEEPYIVYYCGHNKTGSPAFHETPGLIKQLSLEEAEEIYNAIGAKNKDVTFCLMEWSKYIEVYQFTRNLKEDFIKNSFKYKPSKQ